ncbi:HD superfamily phosphodiesterase [Clostridium punense]|uniref:HD superfamily phosphodiesterase n=1 Tax=Clostridium punense TaxID=1054297 RepID=A0ABS4K7Z3_9CLOT|nr:MULTISPECIES: HD domain-containing protein [Clostridium]EQB87970.1 hypothetical protein M918_06150 [Clostridium sp. BL8]MBP2023251.1 HD superfamily phosphodiesterase [Clostridium punense]
MFKERAIEKMKEVFKENTWWMDHTFSVLKYAEEIMEGEKIPQEEREQISLIAILHDIGAIDAIKIHGSDAAPYQEKEGARVSREILEKIGYPKEKIDRISYVVGSHHTFSKIDGVDFQIQWEADLLVNLETRPVRSDREKLKAAIEDNFKTTTGITLACERYLK